MRASVDSASATSVGVAGERAASAARVAAAAAATHAPSQAQVESALVGAAAVRLSRTQALFCSGALAGIVSASSTHALDVGKVKRQLGQTVPSRFYSTQWWRGITMGTLAQGQRFACTITIDKVLQDKLKQHRLQQQQQRFEGNAAAEGRFAKAIIGLQQFGLSMFASGVSEFMANPPVAIKNFQIAKDLSVREALRAMAFQPLVHPAAQGPNTWLSSASGHVPSRPCAQSAGWAHNNGIVAVEQSTSSAALSFKPFFRGVLPGMVRKSVANALVLQSLQPTKDALQPAMLLLQGWWGGAADPRVQAGLVGFVAGAICGGVAEVATNPVDRVKTIMQANPQTSALRGIALAAQAPLAGAGFAMLRKGAIRGINWATVSLLMAAYDARLETMQR